MPVTPRERLARVLDGSQAPGAFSAQLSVPARDVRLTVTGAGPIGFPVKAPQAKRMIASAQPARFGRGEQTLMDLSVRDTWEITPDQVTLTGLDWDAILAGVRDELGLPVRARLRAEPHALLVYGKGQFFLPHQDSEKDDTMIGTLVVSLPSSHTGGELLIEHNGKTVAYQASADEVSVAAFYADCRHEVKPVRTGYRVTFTCNLLLDSDPAGDVPTEPSSEAARYLTEHFTASRGRRVASAACLRGPGGGVAFVGAGRAECPAGCGGPGSRAGRRGVRRAVLEGAWPPSCWNRYCRAGDPGIALALLRVTPAHAGGLAKLAARYGESWHRDLLDSVVRVAEHAAVHRRRGPQGLGRCAARAHRGGSPRSPNARPGPMTTGRSPGPAAAAANYAAHSAGSSPTAASARWSGRSPRAAAGTSRTRSALPSCQSSMRSGSSAARTRWY